MCEISCTLHGLGARGASRCDACKAIVELFCPSEMSQNASTFLISAILYICVLLRGATYYFVIRSSMYDDHISVLVTFKSHLVSRRFMHITQMVECSTDASMLTSL